ncbi:Hypothetical_protein [Hexamita inflata]|uniref:Hypothetical_protein n=1 Tax=Hexamita inflata TaxID=28002 RepID=A0AA86U059_9EUKA|nr:Hypothetical protein HINF_LOCUS22829 [Hexamita inflata]
MIVIIEIDHLYTAQTHSDSIYNISLRSNLVNETWSTVSHPTKSNILQSRVYGLITDGEATAQRISFILFQYQCKAHKQSFDISILQQMRVNICTAKYLRISQLKQRFEREASIDMKQCAGQSIANKRRNNGYSK